MLPVAAVAITSLGLAWASIEDLKKGEIPDRISLGLIGIILASALAHSLLTSEPQYIVSSVLWGLTYFTLSYVLFWLGQWGGGDVKLMAGIGACMGYLDSLGFLWPNSVFFGNAIHPLMTYFINMALISMPYALLYSLVLGLMRARKIREVISLMGGRKNAILLALSILPALSAMYLGLTGLARIYLIVPFFVLATAYMKAVEKILLTKEINVSELRVWDILAKDVVVDGVKIATKRNIEGVTPEQVERIKQLAQSGGIPGRIEIRWGIKFVPALFICFPLTLAFGNLLEILFRLVIQLH